MTMFCGSGYAWRRMVPATFILAFLGAWSGAVHAQSLETALTEESSTGTPYALFQYSTLTGSGNTIFAARVPVINSVGVAKYFDVTLQFNVDLNGNLTLATGYPRIVGSQTLIVSNFKAGNYVGPSTIYSGEMAINVSGPGVTTGGATEWSLASVKGAYACTYPETATWYVGPLTSNPLYPRLKAAGITSTAWYYGVGSSANCNNSWGTNALLGFSQIGNTLTIVSFTYAGVDKSEPVDTVTYTLQ